MNLPAQSYQAVFLDLLEKLHAMTTLQSAENFLAAMRQRDLETIVGLFAQDVDWYIPGDEKLAPWLGKCSDRNGVRDFFSTLWLATEPLSANVEHLFVEDDKAVVIGEFSTRMLATGKVVDSMFHIHMTFKDGLIIRYRLLEDSLAVQQALSL